MPVSKQGSEAGLGVGGVFERFIKGESVRDWLPPEYEQFQRPHSYIIIRLHNESTDDEGDTVQQSVRLGRGGFVRCSDDLSPHQILEVHSNTLIRLFGEYKIVNSFLGRGDFYNNFTYGCVPVPLVRQFIISQGGEAHLPPFLGGVSDAGAIEVLEGWGEVVAKIGDIEIEEAR